MEGCLTDRIALCSMNSEQAVTEHLFRCTKLQQSLWKQVPRSCFSCHPVAVFCKTDVTVIMQTKLTSLIIHVISLPTKFDWRYSEPMLCLRNVYYNHAFALCPPGFRLCVDRVWLKDCYLHCLSVCLEAVCC